MFPAHSLVPVFISLSRSFNFFFFSLFLSFFLSFFLSLFLFPHFGFSITGTSLSLSFWLYNLLFPSSLSLSTSFFSFVVSIQFPPGSVSTLELFIIMISVRILWLVLLLLHLLYNFLLLSKHFCNEKNTLKETSKITFCKMKLQVQNYIKENRRQGRIKVLVGTRHLFLLRCQKK